MATDTVKQSSDIDFDDVINPVNVEFSFTDEGCTDPGIVLLEGLSDSTKDQVNEVLSAPQMLKNEVSDDKEFEFFTQETAQIDHSETQNTTDKANRYVLDNTASPVVIHKDEVINKDNVTSAAESIPVSQNEISIDLDFPAADVASAAKNGNDGMGDSEQVQNSNREETLDVNDAPDRIDENDDNDDSSSTGSVSDIHTKAATIKSDGVDSDDEFSFSLPDKVAKTENNEPVITLEEEEGRPDPTGVCSAGDVTLSLSTEGTTGVKDIEQDSPPSYHVTVCAAQATVNRQDVTMATSTFQPTNVVGSNQTVSTYENQAVGNTPSSKYAVTDQEDEGKTADVLQAEADWANVQTVTPALGEQSENATQVKASSPPVSLHEVMEHIKTYDLDQYKAKIITGVSRSGFAALKYKIFGPPKLQRELREERDQLFCLAECPFENSNSVHVRVLQTIYKKLTGSRFDPPRFGSHWEEIGFQGTDPSTDLRGTGFLCLVHLVHFVTDPKMLNLAREVYRLSQHETQNFPFCVMGINITRLCLGAIREGSVNKECNKRKNLMDTINELYVGTYLHLYQIWKQQHKTIADSGFVLKDVETQMKKNPNLILNNLKAHMDNKNTASQSAATTGAASSGGEANEPVVFSKMPNNE